MWTRHGSTGFIATRVWKMDDHCKLAITDIWLQFGVYTAEQTLGMSSACRTVIIDNRHCRKGQPEWRMTLKFSRYLHGGKQEGGLSNSTQTRSRSMGHGSNSVAAS